MRRFRLRPALSSRQPQTVADGSLEHPWWISTLFYKPTFHWRIERRQVIKGLKTAPVDLLHLLFPHFIGLTLPVIEPLGQMS